MNGILCVNKPKSFTSFDVIAKLRGIINIKRLGHSGTLDPMAIGVLLVLIGAATKACDIMPNNKKSYLAGFKFGEISDTQDITGTVLKISDKAVSCKAIENVLSQFIGKTMQVPPMYSAVQINGTRLYTLARRGIYVERKPREIEIFSLNIIEYNEKRREGQLEICCEKGVYVRTLINDIGKKLGCGGIMTSLIRTNSNGVGLNECFTFDQIQKAADEKRLEHLILPIEYIFSSLPQIQLCETQTRMYRNGIKLDLLKIRNIKDNICRYLVYGFNGKFIGTAFADSANGILRVEKNLT